MELFHPSSKHGALPPLLFSQKREDVYKALPELARLSEFMDSLVIRKEPGEKEGATSALTMPDGAATKAIEDFNYKPMIEEAAKLAEEYRSKASATAGSHLFIYRAVARHIVAMYLHIDQYRSFHATYDSSRNFLEQNFGLAKNSTPADLETLVLETEKATRGYGPEDDTVQLLKDKKLSFVLAYPDYAAAYLRPDTKPDSVHNLDPVAYLLGGTAEKYFKLLHLAVESKLGPLVESAEAMINGVPSEKRAEIINRAADRAREAACVIIKMPELSDPAVYLHLRWFIQGPYNSPSYPEGITVRGVKIAPGGETGSQSSFAIMSDLVSGVRYAFKEDSLSKMEQIHRTTREQGTINFLDRLWESAEKCHASACPAERLARARLLQATNFYLLGHSAAYTIHVLAQQKSQVCVAPPDPKRQRKEDVATGGSAGSFLIKKVIERQEFLDKLIQDLEGTSHEFADKKSNELFKQQLELVKRHTEGCDREKGLDLTILRELVGFSEEHAVKITPALP
eukprot:TRINITY_DN11297_c0_g1_i3.p1 TRINITY_DN11297_c0_g1~~TRINITY_DN11297_c0_g1_i3.p1  ORF type:complete len:512 (+),score=129.55 TRINITY_DN11297_c0_g1_i3:57-1592(+)